MVFCSMGTGKYILYIDDDPDDQENFGYALKRSSPDIHLTTADDAYDALEKLGSQAKPGCIYLDINMPKMDGIQLLKILKGRTDLAVIPVIIFSTGVDAKSKDEAMRLGAAQVFPKPSSLHWLLNHLRSSISTHFQDGVKIFPPFDERP